MFEETKVRKTILRGPSRTRLAWIKLLCAFHFMPKAKVVLQDRIEGRTLEITYRVFWTYSFGMPGGRAEGFRAIPVRITASDGDVLVDKISWNRVACDAIAIDPSTRRGEVTFNPANGNF